MWATIVAGLQALIFALGHITGSLGTGIFLTSVLLRLALLPISLRVARRVRQQQDRLKALQPELDALRTRHRKDPRRLHEETFALFQRHQYNPVDGRSLLGGLLQLPPLSAIFAALRTGLGSGSSFAWIADLARPDAFLIIGVAALTALTTALGAPPGVSRAAQLPALVISIGLTVFFLASTSSAMGLSMAGSSLVGIGQALWLRHPSPGHRPGKFRP